MNCMITCGSGRQGKRWVPEEKACVLQESLSMQGKLMCGTACPCAQMLVGCSQVWSDACFPARISPAAVLLQAEAAERARAELRGLKDQLAAAAAQQEAAAAAMQGERLRQAGMDRLGGRKCSYPWLGSGRSRCTCIRSWLAASTRS